MNGRVYDPVLGKFLSADPKVQFAKDVRGYNRYAYVSNNPLKYTDPTGFLRDRIEKWFKKHFGTILNVASIFYAPLRPFAAAYGMMYATYYGASMGQIAASGLISFIGGSIGAYATGIESMASATFRQAVISGVISGGISGGLNSMITGTRVSRGALQGMMVGAVTAGIAWKVNQSPAKPVKTDKPQGGNPFSMGREVGQVADSGSNYTPLGLKGDDPHLSKRDARLLAQAVGEHKEWLNEIDNEEMRQQFLDLSREPDNLSGNLMVNEARTNMMRSLSKMQLDSLTVTVADGLASTVDAPIGTIVLAPSRILSAISDTLTISGELATKLPMIPGLDNITIACNKYGCSALISTIGR